MDPSRFAGSTTGQLVPISGNHPRYGPFEHVALVPAPLPQRTPQLSMETFTAIAAAHGALASFDSSARRLPNPALLRRPTLRREAQSTSALEGTFAPLEEVLAADEDEPPSSGEMREILNYVGAAEHAFGWLAEGRPLTTGLLTDLQGQLVSAAAADTDQAGHVRTIQVAIGAHTGALVKDARFVPSPPGPELEAQVRHPVDWIGRAPQAPMDPVVAAGMAHYQFETVHPSNDGDGRIGRLLGVLHLLDQGLLTEPSLTVSPWFEARRTEYDDRLLGVSAEGAWDPWLRFFADGLRASADQAAQQLTELLDVQARLQQRVRDAGLRAESAMRLVEYLLEQAFVSVRQVERKLGVSCNRANTLVGQMVEAGVLEPFGASVDAGRFYAPDVLTVLLGTGG